MRYRNLSGKPQWQCRAGKEAQRIKKRRETLVKHGKASFYCPYKNGVEAAIRAAGL